MKSYFRENRGLLFVNVALAVAVGLAFALGADLSPMLSPEGAGSLLMAEAVTVADLKAIEKSMKEAFEAMGVNLRKAQEVADNALNESKKLGGTIEAKTADLLKSIDEDRVKVQDRFKSARDEFVALEQKITKHPGQGSGEAHKSIHEIITGSKQFAAAADAGQMLPVDVPAHLLRHGKTQIVNATLNNDQPLVQAHRIPGIITPAEQRLYIRDLIPQASFDGNLVEFTREASFTSNARPQGDASPGGVEGESFAESAMTFELANAAVVTLGHWIPASRQVLSDAKLLRGHIEGRLLYGLELEEETELLTGSGAAGKISGINSNATAYNRGATNDTVLDTLLKAILQVSLSNYEASGFIMHPVDWYTAMLLKDTTNRYLFSDPQSMVQPRVWSKPVVASQSQTSGKFTCGAFSLACQIWDRETATVRISENVASHFVQNMVAILVQKRLAFAIYRTTAMVYGNTSHAG
jgi:HK97 family phage major capsid protein